jgi:hypothetical protein
VRLLLDEHYAPEVASALRDRGHDVIAVAERQDLRRKIDIDILMAAALDGRVVVTEDAKDFMPIGLRRLPSREPHSGIVLVSPHAFPRSRNGFGLLIRALDALLIAHLGDVDLVGEVVWLKRAADDRLAE